MPGYREGGGKGIPGGGAGPAHLYGALAFQPVILPLLPEPYGTLLAPVGAALTAGEREDLLLLTREEVYHAVQEGRRQRGERGRLVTALCLSGALLAIVVLL